MKQQQQSIFDEPAAGSESAELKTIFGGQVSPYAHGEAATFATSQEGVRLIQSSRVMMFGGCDWVKQYHDPIFGASQPAADTED